MPIRARYCWIETLLALVIIKSPLMELFRDTASPATLVLLPNAVTISSHSLFAVREAATTSRPTASPWNHRHAKFMRQHECAFKILGNQSHFHPPSVNLLEATHSVLFKNKKSFHSLYYVILKIREREKRSYFFKKPIYRRIFLSRPRWSEAEWI